MPAEAEGMKDGILEFLIMDNPITFKKVSKNRFFSTLLELWIRIRRKIVF